MTTVLRLTRHPAEADQTNALRAIYGPDVNVIERSVTVASAAEVVALADETNADVIEAVLPPALLAAVIPAVAPRPLIRAVMARTVNPDGAATFAFTRYERVIRVEVVTEPLGA